MKLGRALGVFLLSWSAVACGDTTNQATASAGAGGTDGGGSQANSPGGSASAGSGGTAQQDLLRRYVEAFCGLFARCMPLLLSSTTECEAALTPAYETALQSEPITSGRVVYHPEGLSECIASIEASTCDEKSFSACQPVFEGTTAWGEPCTLDAECVDNGQCLVNGACPGVCGARAKLGEACSTYNACADGLGCGGDPNAPTCQRLAKTGESCGDEIGCAAYTVCVDQKCISRASRGQSEQGGPCDALTGPDCKPDLVCTTALDAGIVVGRCQPKVASGAACTFSTPDPCPEDEYCHITSPTGEKPATGVCQSKPQLGDECRYGTYNVTSCPQGQYCDVTTKVCTLKKDLGADCTSITNCNNGACVAGKCVENLECERSKAEAQ